LTALSTLKKVYAQYEENKIIYKSIKMFYSKSRQSDKVQSDTKEKTPELALLGFSLWAGL